MELPVNYLAGHNESLLPAHLKRISLSDIGLPEMERVIGQLMAFQVAIPSWALGTGGTRFGRFSGGGEPRCLEEKVSDVGLLHALNRSSGRISLHIPWDIPDNYEAILILAGRLGLSFDAVNSNTFQDQPGQTGSYRYGSLNHSDRLIRDQAVAHNIEVIGYGVKLGAKALSVWLADGSNFPGQLNFRAAFGRTLQSLKEIYAALPEDWKLWIEYKPYEPNFYSTTIPDWGTCCLLASKLGPRAATLVDLGHHLPGTNIEQIVALLLSEGKLAGFHFNDSKYGDDDLTTGSINPYQLFLIFNELVEGMDNFMMPHATAIGYMIDASHTVKDPLLDLLQSVEAIKIAYAQALLVDTPALKLAQQDNDVVLAEQILLQAFRTDVRPLLAEARLRLGAALDPVGLFTKLEIRSRLTAERGASRSTGL